MSQRIRILKGMYNKIRISDSTFPILKPLETSYGKTIAVVDASSLLGDEYKIVKVEVEDYKLLD
jgi:hypothetical protein